MKVFRGAIAPVILGVTGLAPLASAQECCDTAVCCDTLGCDGAVLCDGGACRGKSGDLFALGDPFSFMDDYVITPDMVTTTFGGPCNPTKVKVGLQVRHRFHDEDNRLRPAGQTATDYQLWRIRPFLDITNDYGQIHFEGIDASQFGEEIGALPIDVNRADLLEGWAGVNVYDDLFGGKGQLRWGRQTLLYGDQHLLSPLEWANTRRNFEGWKFIHKASDYQLDLFSMNSVNLAAQSDGGSFLRFDQTDDNYQIQGGWMTLTGYKPATIDFYAFYQDEQNQRNGVIAPGGPFIPGQADGFVWTIGSRLNGKIPVKECDKVVRTYDWNTEFIHQFGREDSADVDAIGISLYGGHTWNTLPWSPRVGGLFWYGSGTSAADIAEGERGTLDTLWPLGHKYWGIIDNFSGQNLVDYSLQFSAKPSKKFSFFVHYHWFDRASEDDAIYNIAGVPLGGAALLANGDDEIGQELDIVGTYKVNANLAIQVGYSEFFYADNVAAILPQAGAVAAGGDGEFFYVQTNYQF